MALPTPEVLANLDELITTVTGFTNAQDNFEPCRRYCLSHFVHHIYPSVNKSTVRKTVDDLGDRFYTHGHFELSKALRTQVDKFLSHEDTFKANPECQIEWGLLSLVTSLATNLSKLHDVPSLLPTEDHIEVKDDFDWTSYLKEGLPVYNPDTDSDSFSSLSSEEDTSSDLPLQSFSSIVSSPVAVTEDSQNLKNDDFLEIRKLFKLTADERNNRPWLKNDLLTKKDFATKWKNLNSPNEPFFLVSEKEAVEIIFNALLTGESLDGLQNATVSFLGKETFQICLSSFKPYLEAIRSIHEFTAFVETFDSPVVAHVYASCLKKTLLRYELKILDASQEDLSLMQLIENINPCLQHMLNLSTVHKICVSDGFENAPSWQISLRILGGLYDGMISNHRPELRCHLAGMFLECHAVYGRIIDALLTSSSAVDPCQEFYISRESSVDGTNCKFLIRSFESILPFVDIISKQVNESSSSLSLLYQMNRFPHPQKNQVFVNDLIFQSLKKHYWVESEEKEETVLSQEMATLDPTTDLIDFQQVTSWLEKSESVVPVYKIIEMALSEAVENQLEVVRKSAMKILIEEMSLQRHLTLLRNVYFCNDASLLLPFIQHFFNEESCWTNADYLTMLLRECIAVDFPDLAGNISVSVNTAEGQVHQNVIQAIGSLEIVYQVPYPISLVITPAVIVKYNAIFKILLKLKWAHTLSYLRFPDKNSTPHPAARCVMHRLQILRFSCLTDLHVISNYFFAQVTTTMSKNCEDFSHVQDLIREHEQLIERIHSRCMLSEGDQHYTLIFDAIIPLVVDLRRCWSLEETHIVAKLKVMENIFKATHTKLRRLMGFLEKETYVPLVAKLREESMMSVQLTKFTSFGSIG